MVQDTTGLKAALSLPRVYDFVQNALGARRARRVVAEEFLRVKDGDFLLDVGCGTGEMLEHLPAGTRYLGLDLSASYIASARSRFGGRARFECMDVNRAADLEVAQVDLALAFGLLHHLDDQEVVALLATLKGLVRPGGRVVTIDPTLFSGQGAIAAFVARQDRGRNVRSPEHYAALASGVFAQARPVVRNDLLRIPYSHCIIEMTP